VETLIRESRSGFLRNLLGFQDISCLLVPQLGKRICLKLAKKSVFTLTHKASHLQSEFSFCSSPDSEVSTQHLLS
jgi:hypothetical protein